MTRLISWYRWFKERQGGRRFRIVAAALALVGCLSYFGPVLQRSRDLQHQRVALGQALADQSLKRNDPHALSLIESGTVTLDGTTYGGDDMRRRAPYLFDEQGQLASPAAVAAELVASRRPAWAPSFLVDQPGTTLLLAVAVTAFFQLVVWLELVLQFALVLAGTMLAASVVNGVGWPALAQALTKMGVLVFTFVALIRVVLVVFSAPHQSLAVAHTVVKEATRSRLALVFVVFLLMLLPLVPLALQADAPLRYRIQTYIGWSLGLTYTLAACMTIFLACGSVAFEIRDRQIWQLVSKPMRRMSYLSGKWIGVVSVNAVILVVAGLSNFMYVQYMRMLPVAPGDEGMLDRLAVNEEVLTARLGARPHLDVLTGPELRARVEHTIANDQHLSSDGEVPLSVKRKIARDLQEEYLNAQRSVPPVEPEHPGGNQHTYTFTGLGQARELAATITLHYRFHIFRDDEHETYPVGFVINGDPATATAERYVPTVTHTLPIGTHLVRDDGTMDITVVNLFEPPPSMTGRGELNFEAQDFELLYKVAGFETNFARAILMTGLKLAFLAVLGIACSTLLSFPVACLLTFTIFLAGTIGPFLAMSLEEYYPTPASQLDWSNPGLVVQWAFQSFIRATAQGLVFALSSFGEYRPTTDLVEGRLIAWGRVVSGALWLGAVWSGIALAFGWIVMRNRQLAIYSGHG